MLINLVWRLFGKKYALGGLLSLYRAVTGYRTQIVATLVVLVYAGKTLGFVPAELADQLLVLLAGAGGMTMTSKLARIDEQYGIQQKAAELRGEAFKQLKADGIISDKVNDVEADGLCKAVLPDEPKNDSVRG